MNCCNLFKRVLAPEILKQLPQIEILIEQDLIPIIKEQFDKRYGWLLIDYKIIKNAYRSDNCSFHIIRRDYYLELYFKEVTSYKDPRLYTNTLNRCLRKNKTIHQKLISFFSQGGSVKFFPAIHIEDASLNYQKEPRITYLHTRLTGYQTGYAND